ncbi:hypothetical protein DV515_00016232 [Chloebia gouldiae]|uniref:Uncharacterized protein n=1 Tax=Chloebia gouldiae TaxID=44316 RepID=A0A3L8RTM2_CHLGU|nr:hypothetical protein DV515_00016232 [Chloebia gouldiae]
MSSPGCAPPPHPQRFFLSSLLEQDAPGSAGMSQQQKQPQQIPAQCQQKCGALPKGVQQSSASKGQAKAGVKSLPQQQQQQQQQQCSKQK